ncbi:MAG: hypothetical protein LBP79_01715 [Clostridiales bacterium]|jgi:hypothetical protein|nr:hypothetical protein [Clostridiales bacterium]
MNHITFWEKKFGNSKTEYDFRGREVHKDCYGNEKSPYGWNIDHTQPEGEGGEDTDENKQIVNIATNREKGDKTTFVSDDGKTYQVQKRSGVERSTDSDRAKWANGYNYSGKKYRIVILELK